MSLPLALFLVALVPAQAPARTGAPSGAPSGDPMAPPPPAYPPPSEAELAGHRQMLALLEDVRLKTPRQNAYLGDSALKKLLETRAELDEATAPPKSLARLDYDIGKNLLRLGRNEEALARLRACHERLVTLPRAEWPAYGERLSYDLGVAAMRKGESDNCVARHTAQSCLLPIEKGGVHADPAGSREAMQWLRDAMKNSPDEVVRLCSRWLLNIAAMTVGDYPQGLTKDELVPPAVYASDSPFPRFTDVAPALGLNNFDLSGGAILEDFDGDGLLDVFTSSWNTSEPLHFHRSRGDGTFEDRSQAANLEGLYGGLNMLQCDFDDDGWIDVFVLRGAWLFGPRGQIPKSLLQNRGGTFLDVTIRAGLNEQFYPSQAGGFADYDLDGDLDLYLGSEANTDAPFSGLLFQNQGDGTFRDVARAARVENVRFCKGVSWGDYDVDRWPDLYCSNLGAKNRLYRNHGDGTFEDVAEALGVTHPINGFPTWFWDFDNDGVLDIFASSYEFIDPDKDLRVGPVAASYLGLPFEGELSCLYRGDGKGGFTDVARARNLLKLNLPMGSNFADLDGDGFLDFYLGTGYPGYDGLVPNQLYWNRGGERFDDVSAAAGMGHLQKGHGVSFGDLDMDGDLDLFEQMGGAYPGDGFGDVLYENPGFGHHWLELRLVGIESVRSAVGTRVRVDYTEGGAKKSLWRWVNSGGSFGCNPLRQHIGLGRAEGPVRVELFWPKTGKTQVFEGVPLDARLELTEGASAWRKLETRPFHLGGGAR
jgi:ASPIC/UnbV protein/VCBS repeat protein